MRQPESRGRFITFEGPEGSGKSTQIERLARRLRAAGHRVLLTREPGGTPTGEAIRGILQHDHAGEPICPQAELLLFEASRAQLVQCVIRPALAAGTWVLCDRFVDSTTAYQGYARGFGLKVTLAINAFAVQGCMPDLTILLDAEVRTGFRRLAARNRVQKTTRDRFEREHRDFHERVRRGYLKLAKRWPKRIRVISTMRPIGTVEADIWRTVRDAFHP
jgi:dTMP kinase